MKLVILLFAFLSIGKAFAYPQFIGFGYTSCLTCHYNPLGNGPLTDYGRAVSATAIAGRVWFPSDTSEDTIANSSGFLFQKWEKNKNVRPSINFRQLYLQRRPGTKKEQNDEITMMLSANLVLKTADDKTYISADIGYAPEPAGGRSSQEDESTYRSREYYIGHRLSTNWGLYAGLMDKAFGIRVDDHTAFSRSTNGLAQNDQSHGFLIHFVNEKMDVAFNYFLGNLGQEEEVRQVGQSATMEYTLFPMTRIGASALSSESEVVTNSIYSVHSRIGFGKGSSVMLEVGQTNRKSTTGTNEIDAQYYFMQNQISLKRGLFFNYTLEWFVPNVESELKALRLGPGLQWMPGQRLEFRIDLYNSRAFNPNGVSEDTWDVAGQVHIWL